jgi:hypothetical protein
MSPEPHDYVPALRKRLAHLKQRNPHAMRARPRLYAAASAADAGTRPLADAGDYYNAGIRLYNTANGGLSPSPKGGQTYRVTLDIRNAGALAAYGGIAEFYVGPKASFSQLAQGPTSEATQTALHVARLGKRIGFTLQAGQELQGLEASVLWSPHSEDELSVLAQVYDPFCDRLEHPFSAQDRHVARRDFATRFDGVWSGLVIDPGPAGGRLHYLPSMSVYLAMQQNPIGPSPGHVDIDIVLQPRLGPRPILNITGSATGAVIEDTLRFSETFSTAGATTDWVVVRTGEKLLVSFGAHTGELDSTPGAAPPPPPPSLVAVGGRHSGH